MADPETVLLVCCSWREPWMSSPKGRFPVGSVRRFGCFVASAKPPSPFGLGFSCKGRLSGLWSLCSKGCYCCGQLPWPVSPSLSPSGSLQGWVCSPRLPAPSPPRVPPLCTHHTLASPQHLPGHTPSLLPSPCARGTGGGHWPGALLMGLWYPPGGLCLHHCHLVCNVAL